MNRIDYALLKIIEEASEVQKIAAKALAFGLDDFNPNEVETNHNALVREIRDFVFAVQKLAGACGSPELGLSVNIPMSKVTMLETKWENWYQYHKDREKEGRHAGDFQGKQ